MLRAIYLHYLPRFLPQTLTTMLLCSVIGACGKDSLKSPESHDSTSNERRQGSQHDSELEWKKSRPNTERYAYLEDRDFSDPFLLGVSVVKTDDFFSSALNMSVPPQKVKLVMAGEDGDKKLRIENAQGQSILTFGLARQGNEWEVDFASSGNDVEFTQLMDAVGGMFTASSRYGHWVSQGPPTVAQVFQDDDTAVVDLVHTVSQVLAEKDAQGNLVVRRRISQVPGQVTLRLWLKRQNSLPKLDGDRTVGMAKQHKIGYFGSIISLDAEGELKPIQRLPIGAAGSRKSATFYLKDFPANYVALGKRAVSSWNTAFGYEAIKVEVAPAHIDAGDPRYHVIKWFDNTDATIPWAGVAKMIVDPDSGVVIGGSVYIQGSSLLTAYRKIVDYTHSSSKAGNRLLARVGNATFRADEGEIPVIPHYTNVDSSFDDYMAGYYYETIVHEVGHVLGLRHNFKGSTELDSEGYVASIMDYLPRAHRHFYRGPGAYDIAAVRWGYFGEEPEVELPYCSDEDLWSRWDCHQSDLGNPANYVIRGLTDGPSLLSEKAIEVTDQSQISSLAMLMEHAMKIWKFKDQMDDATRQKVEERLPAAYKHFFDVAPAAWLEGSERAIVEKNLQLLRKLGQMKLAQLKAQGKYIEIAAGQDAEE